MDNQDVARIPEALSDPSILRIFTEVARQEQQRGWALLFPANVSEMTHIEKLVECGLITVDGDVRRFDIGGRSKSAEVICQLTEPGKVASSTIAGRIE
jgi:hypothetical protein